MKKLSSTNTSTLHDLLANKFITSPHISFRISNKNDMESFQIYTNHYNDTILIVPHDITK